MAYNGRTKLISGISQANGQTFPLVDASAVYVNDNTRLNQALAQKQDKLDATNLKTINGASLLGSGDITVGTTASDISSLQTAISLKADQATTYTKNEVNEYVADQIASNRPTYVVDHVSDLATFFMVVAESDGEHYTLMRNNKAVLIGTNILITDLNVPDYWVKAGYSTSNDVMSFLSPLESTKTDLTNYSKTSDLIGGNIVVKTTKDYDTDSGNIKTEFDSIKTRLDDLEYVPVEITSFTCSPSLSELGTTTTSVTFNWNFKGTPTSATIGTATISTPATTKTYTLSNQSITARTTFTLTLKDSRDRVVTRSCTLSFANRIYWGVAAIPTSYTSTFIKGLSNNTLATNSARTITLTLGSGQYGYFCVPATWNPTFKVGGFDGGFEDGQTVTFITNSYSTSYKVYRTTNPNLGTITIEIKEGN